MALSRWDRLELPEMWRRFFDFDGGSNWLRVEEFAEDKTLVVRAELPGIDPDKDVELSVRDNVLHIWAKREEKSEHKDKEGYRSEFRYGSFTRTVPLPAGTKAEEVRATYDDGILEIRVPVAEPVEVGARKVPITKG